jgi:glycosyltransferase involved in cell wall biosynthesis
LPNAILEAMAMARPAVATRVSDVPFLLGEHGFLVAPGDARALGDAIARMVQLGAERRAAMGRALLARARSEFGMENAVRTFWDAHLDLLPKGSG